MNSSPEFCLWLIGSKFGTQEEITPERMPYSSLSFTITIYQNFIMEFSSLLKIIIIISSILSVVHKYEAVLFSLMTVPTNAVLIFFSCHGCRPSNNVLYP